MLPNPIKNDTSRQQNHSPNQPEGTNAGKVVVSVELPVFAEKLKGSWPGPERPRITKTSLKLLVRGAMKIDACEQTINKDPLRKQAKRYPQPKHIA